MRRKLNSERFCLSVAVLAAAAGLSLVPVISRASTVTVTQSWTDSNLSSLPNGASSTYFKIIAGSTVTGLNDSNNVVEFDSTASQNLGWPTFSFGNYFETWGNAVNTSTYDPNATVTFTLSESLASGVSGEKADTQLPSYYTTSQQQYQNKFQAVYSDGSNLYPAWTAYNNMSTTSTSMATVSSAAMTTLSNYYSYAPSSNPSIVTGASIPVSYINNGNRVWLTGFSTTTSDFSQKSGTGYASVAYLDNFSVTVATTYTLPEPATLVLMAAMGAGLLMVGRKRKVA